MWISIYVDGNRYKERHCRWVLLIGADQLRLIATFCQSVCNYKLDSNYLQTCTNLSVSDCSQSESDGDWLETHCLSPDDPHNQKWLPKGRRCCTFNLWGIVVRTALMYGLKTVALTKRWGPKCRWQSWRYWRSWERPAWTRWEMSTTAQAARKKFMESKQRVGVTVDGQRMWGIEWDGSRWSAEPWRKQPKEKENTQTHLLMTNGACTRQTEF